MKLTVNNITTSSTTATQRTVDCESVRLINMCRPKGHHSKCICDATFTPQFKDNGRVAVYMVVKCTNI